VAIAGREDKGLNMFSLTVYRGDKLVQELDFDTAEVNIGRKPENAVVLADDGKGVSRIHAILRVEDGEFVLYDGNSRNGTYVDGKPIKRVVIYPGQDFVVGPYRLVLGASEVDESAAPTMVATRVPAPPPIPPAPEGTHSKSSEGSTKSRLPAQVKPSPAPARSGATKPLPLPIPYLAAGGAVVLILAAILIWSLLPGSEPGQVVVLTTTTTTSIPESTTTVPEEPPPDPYAVQIADATAAMDAAESTFAAKNYRAAAREFDRIIRDRLAPILSADATYAPAIELEARAKTRAAEAMKLAPPLPPPAPEPIRPGPNDVAVRPGESREDYDRRNKEANTDYDLGRRYLSEGNLLDASRLFADLAAREPGWRDVSTYARNAQESLDKERQRALDEGVAHDNVGFKAANASNLAAAATEYLAARKAYERAAALQAPQAPKLLAGNLERRRALAQSALAEAQTHLNFRNRAEARKWLQLVIDLLPAGEPNRKQAESYLAKLAPGF
jgi:pSer/pThr/pTyr-binding forkhead associated (FHA) protein